MVRPALEVVPPRYPRAPTQAAWLAMTEAERRAVADALPVVNLREEAQRLREEAEVRAAEAERRATEAERARDAEAQQRAEAEARVQALEAELARLRGGT